MPTATAEKVRLTPNQLKAANRMLEYLDGVKQSNWQQTMRDQLTESEYATAAANVDRAVAAMDGGPIGAIVGGTGLAKEEARIEGEDAQIAIQALKESHRLVQCGQGRGKLLVLISSEPLASGVTFTPKKKVAKPKAKAKADSNGKRRGRPPKHKAEESNSSNQEAVVVSTSMADRFEDLSKNLSEILGEMAKIVRESEQR